MRSRFSGILRSEGIVISEKKAIAYIEMLRSRKFMIHELMSIGALSSQVKGNGYPKKGSALPAVVLARARKLW